MLRPDAATRRQWLHHWMLRLTSVSLGTSGASSFPVCAAGALICGSGGAGLKMLNQGRDVVSLTGLVLTKQTAAAACAAL